MSSIIRCNTDTKKESWMKSQDSAIATAVATDAIATVVLSSWRNKKKENKQTTMYTFQSRTWNI